MTSRLTARQKAVLARHLEARNGAPFWQERARAIGLGDVRELKTTDDLLRFGPMDEAALRTRPLEDFIPRAIRQRRAELIVGETGGTKGKPKTTAYTRAEFHAAFVAPFVAAARHVHFPVNRNWLWLGPSGPHIIGKAARACAAAWGAPDPFAVDFDARWAKLLVPGSVGAQRYLAHVVAQACDVLRTQSVGVLFSTPPVLVALADALSRKERQTILGLHFGGLPLTEPVARMLREAFPHAVFLAGYGNTLFGMCPEFRGCYDGPVDYFPHGDRIFFRTVPTPPDLSNAERLAKDVEDGGVGQVVFSRFDDAFMILNMLERDGGVRVRPAPELHAIGFRHDGIRTPGPLQPPQEDKRVAVGLY